MGPEYGPPKILTRIFDDVTNGFRTGTQPTTMETFETRVTEIIQRTHNVKSFRFPTRKDANFQAGQFMEVALPVGGKDESKFFSFSSAPTEKGYIEFTKKLTGSKFSETLKHLMPGDWLKVKMPMGAFTLDPEARKHAFLAGGIGITPVRSMWKYAFDRQLPFDMILLYGNHTPEDIVFRSDFETMQSARKNFKVVLSLDTAEACPAGWKGKCGFINAQMVREEIPDFLERIFYVCGPPAMVNILVQFLQTQLQIPASRIKQENFTGY